MKERKRSRKMPSKRSPGSQACGNPSLPSQPVCRTSHGQAKAAELLTQPGFRVAQPGQKSSRVGTEQPPKRESLKAARSIFRNNSGAVLHDHRDLGARRENPPARSCSTRASRWWLLSSSWVSQPLVMASRGRTAPNSGRFLIQMALSGRKRHHREDRAWIRPRRSSGGIVTGRAALRLRVKDFAAH